MKLILHLNVHPIATIKTALHFFSGMLHLLCSVTNEE